MLSEAADLAVLLDGQRPAASRRQRRVVLEVLVLVAAPDAQVPVERDDRVKVVERCNIRYLNPESLNLKATGEPTLAVMDVSFISVTKTIPNTINLMKEGEGQLIILIKPQFEAGRGKVAKGGVVKDKHTHIELLQSCLSQLQALNLTVAGLTYSPIKGPSGNIEYLLHLLKGEDSTSADIDIPALVEEAFLALN